jgi:hypothetical protein
MQATEDRVDHAETGQIPRGGARLHGVGHDLVDVAGHGFLPAVADDAEVCGTLKLSLPSPEALGRLSPIARS